MLSFTPISLVSVNVTFGASVTGVGSIATKGGEVSSNYHELSVPWRDLTAAPTGLSLLSWHTRVSEFAGLEKELGLLESWADSSSRISLKFLTGEGGTGKSRLGAEFAEKMRAKGWSAGFISLRKPQSFPINKEGVLMIVDYPEEHRDGVAELLKDLAELGNDARYRVLFLSRQDVESWVPFIQNNHAQDMLDADPVEVGRLTGPAAHAMYCSALECMSETLVTNPPPLSEEALSEWLKEAPENHRALFILAAALQSATNPKDEVVKYKGREVVRMLAEREYVRLRQTAVGRFGQKCEEVIARLLAMAAIADAIPIARIAELTRGSDLGLQLPADTDIESELQDAGVLHDRGIPPPKPDIVAAALVVAVLSPKPETAPELIWEALKNDVEGGVMRIARLGYDAEVVLGIRGEGLSEWLAGCFQEQPDRCRALAGILFAENPLPWRKAAVIVWDTQLDSAMAPEEKARILNNKSVALGDIGDNAGALEAIREAMELYRRLSEANPARYEPDLAMSLNNMSGCLSDMGDNAKALRAIREAVEIRRRLSESNPARYEPDLAMGLHNVSNRLSDMGDNAKALEAIGEAVEIRRRLSEANPARYEPDLAMSLGVQAMIVNALGDHQKAIDAARTAIDLLRPFGESHPKSKHAQLLKVLIDILDE